MASVLFFSAHWIISAFFQSFFHHRYASHRMFTMTPRTERTFHVLTYLAQGSSYLSPRAYAILHREHHAYSDTERDPHAPGFFANVLTMMWTTAVRYNAHLVGTSSPEPRFLGNYLDWPWLDRVGSTWVARDGVVAVLAPPRPLGPRTRARRDRQLVRPPLRLSQLPDQRRLAELPALRLPHPGRALPEQPPPRREPPQLRLAPLRVRPDLRGDAPPLLAARHRCPPGRAREPRVATAH